MKTPESIFRSHLESRGLPMTWLHEAVCRAVFDIHAHFTVEELKASLANHPNERELQETLEELIAAGLIRKVIVSENNIFYEHTYGHPHHDHLVCVSCGRTIEFLSAAIEKLQEEAALQHGFKMVGHSLRIEGLCADCAEAARSREPSVRPSLPIEDTEALPLTMMESGSRVRIKELRCGKEASCRLISMGLAEGDIIDVLQNTFDGPMAVRKNDTRIAFGHGLAHKIIVEPVASPETSEDEDTNDAEYETVAPPPRFIGE